MKKLFLLPVFLACMGNVLPAHGDATCSVANYTQTVVDGCKADSGYTFHISRSGQGMVLDELLCRNSDDVCTTGNTFTRWCSDTALGERIWNACDCSSTNWTDGNTCVYGLQSKDCDTFGRCYYNKTACDAANTALWNQQKADLLAEYNNTHTVPVITSGDWTGCVRIEVYQKDTLANLCAKGYDYIAIQGYYRDESRRRCYPCPSYSGKQGVTSNADYGFGYNEITDCYIPSGDLFTDDTGTWTFGEDCYYSR